MFCYVGTLEEQTFDYDYNFIMYIILQLLQKVFSCINNHMAEEQVQNKLQPPKYLLLQYEIFHNCHTVIKLTWVYTP
jgi:hypothetical protein